MYWFNFMNCNFSFLQFCNRCFPNNFLSFFIRSHPEVFIRKRCSENKQQMYRRTPMPKCDFNKVALQLYIEITLSHRCSAVNSLHFFRTPFLENTSGWLLLSFLYHRFGSWLSPSILHTGQQQIYDNYYFTSPWMWPNDVYG